MNIADFQRMILEWGRDNRRDMAWRDTLDPYKILVSEVMLQQTQVSRVLPKYEKFLREFPTLEALASSCQSNLLRTWQGLGYWNRALRLRDAARMVVNEFGGQFPRDPTTLKKLPRRRTIHCRCRRLLRVRKRGAVPRHQHPACLPFLLLPRRGRRFQTVASWRSRARPFGPKTLASGATPSSTTARPSPRQDDQPSQQTLLPAERL